MVGTYISDSKVRILSLINSKFQAVYRRNQQVPTIDRGKTHNHRQSISHFISPAWRMTFKENDHFRNSTLSRVFFHGILAPQSVLRPQRLFFPFLLRSSFFFLMLIFFFDEAIHSSAVNAFKTKIHVWGRTKEKKKTVFWNCFDFNGFVFAFLREHSVDPLYRALFS